MRCRVFLSSLNVKGDDIKSHLTYCSVLHRVIQDIRCPIDGRRRVSMRSRRKLWMSCTLGCIPDADCARTSQGAPTSTIATRLRIGRTTEAGVFSRFNFSSPVVSTVYAAKLREVRPLTSCLGGSTPLATFWAQPAHSSRRSLAFAPLAFRKRTLSSPWQSVMFLASHF